MRMFGGILILLLLLLTVLSFGCEDPAEKAYREWYNNTYTRDVMEQRQKAQEAILKQSRDNAETKENWIELQEQQREEAEWKHYLESQEQPPDDGSSQMQQWEYND